MRYRGREHAEAERFRRKARANLRRLYVQARAGDEDARRTIQDLERMRGHSPLTDRDAVALMRVRYVHSLVQLRTRLQAPAESVAEAQADYQAALERLREGK